jgi:hypothetical protein
MTYICPSRSLIVIQPGCSSPLGILLDPFQPLLPLHSPLLSCIPGNALFVSWSSNRFAIPTTALMVEGFAAVPWFPWQPVESWTIYLQWIRAP